MPLDRHLVRYEQSLDVVGNQDAYSPVEFPGVPPLLVLRDKSFVIVAQSGEAIGWRKVFKAPEPFAGGVLIERLKVAVTRVDSVRWKTVWSYLLAFDAEPTYAQRIAAAKYPTSIVWEAIS